jgi:hypothetical protein
VALPVLISHTGSINGSPAQSSQISPSLQEILNTSFSATYGSSKGSRPSIIGATDLAPFVIPLETIVKVRLMAFRVRGGSLKFKFTSAAGADQALLISDFFLWHAPNAGDEVTAIKAVGTADLEYILSGDVS